MKRFNKHIPVNQICQFVQLHQSHVDFYKFNKYVLFKNKSTKHYYHVNPCSISPRKEI